MSDFKWSYAAEIESLRAQLAAVTQEKDAIRKTLEDWPADKYYAELNEIKAERDALAKVSDSAVVAAYESGYARGHNDTVEGTYGCPEPEEILEAMGGGK